MPIPKAETTDIVCFAPAVSIDPIAVGTPCYLMANGPASAKPYVLLRMALLRVVGEALRRPLMTWPDELRSTAGVSQRPAADVNLPGEEVRPSTRSRPTPWPRRRRIRTGPPRAPAWRHPQRLTQAQGPFARTSSQWSPEPGDQFGRQARSVEHDAQAGASANVDSFGRGVRAGEAL